MGKLDSMIKCAQARNLLNEKQFEKAIEVVDEIEVQKVKSIIDLKIMGEVYLTTGRFWDAREVYFLLYDKVQSRSIVYQMVYLSVQCKMMEEAEDFYEEYKKQDCDSADCFILNYYIQKAKGATRQELILCIREILKIDYLEEWAYELAKLYHKEKMEAECVAECSRIILWFGDGIIVEKAMLLKLHYMDGVDISTPQAIAETRNLAAELRIAAAIANRQEKEALYGKSEFEDNEYEDNEFEENEYEDSEFEDKKFEDSEFETSELKENEFIENEFKDSKLQNNEFEEKEFRDSEFEDSEFYKNEFEDSEFDKNEFEDNEFGNNKFEENEFEGSKFEENEFVKEESEDYFDKGERGLVVKLEDKDSSETFLKDKMETMIETIVKDVEKLGEVPRFSIIGEDQQKMLTITKHLVSRLCENGVLESSRIARISAEKVNQINLEDKRDQLKGSCLLIENAGAMTLTSIQTLYQVIRRMPKLVVILVEEEDATKKLMERNRKLKNLIKYELYV